MLKLVNICRTYCPKKGVPVKALDNISLDIEEKGLVFILGKSGSGKSTLLNVLGGLDRADSGEIIIKDKSSKDFSQSDFDSFRNTMVGFIFQEYNILDEFNVGQNIALALSLQGKKGTTAEVNKILEDVDLVGYGNRKPNELSGGQKQRVAIARALIKEPKIIMADEPTGALDSNTGKQVFETLKKLSVNKLVLVVSHDREFAEQYGDRVIEFSDGKIISDIKKYKASAENISEGVKVIDDNILYVKKDYVLTEKDKAKILDYISNNKTDTFISMSKRANDNFKQNNRINENGEKESFKNTTAENLKIAKYDGELKMIKSKLPFKDSLKIAASGIKGKPIRLIFTILLSAIAFGLFGFVDTIGAFDKIANASESIKSANIPYACFQKQTIINDGDEQEYSSSSNMSEKDYATISAKFKNNKFHKIYNFRLNNFFRYGSMITDSSKLNTQFYHGQFCGFTEINKEDLEALGCSVKGVLPAQDDEIAITEYAYRHFLKGGFTDLSKQDYTITKEEDLIGKTIGISDSFIIKGEKQFKITAIVDTKLDYERYKSIEKTNGVDYSSIGTSLLSSEFNSMLRSSPHSLAFLNNGYLDRFIEDGFNDNHANIKYNFDGDGVNHKIKKCSQAKVPYAFFDEAHNGKPLAENEILICASTYMYEIGISPWNNCFHSALETYAKENLEEAKRLLPSFYLPSWNYYMNKLNGELEFYEMPDGLLNGSQIKTNAFYSYMQGLTDVNLKQPTRRVYNSDRTITETSQKIVGLFYDNYNKDLFTLLIDDVFYNNIIEQNAFYSAFLGKMPNDINGIRSYVTYNYNNRIEDAEYVFTNSVMDTITMILDMIEPTVKLFLYTGIGLACFGALMLLNFISTSIVNKKREIGILRAVGARGNDIFGIFLNESLIIALINFTIATIGCVIATILMNRMLATNYGLQIVLFVFGLRQILLVLAVSVITAIIASAIPVFKISRMKPIDAIRKP